MRQSSNHMPAHVLHSSAQPVWHVPLSIGQRLITILKILTVFFPRGPEAVVSGLQLLLCGWGQVLNVRGEYAMSGSTHWF